MVYTVAASEGRTSGLPVGESSRPSVTTASPGSPGTVQIARYAPLCNADTAVLLPMKTGGQILAVWSANASAVYMGFSGTPEALANVTSANPLQKDSFFDDVFSTTGNGTFNAAASDPFRGMMGAPGQDGLLSVGSLQPIAAYTCLLPVNPGVPTTELPALVCISLSTCHATVP